MLHADAALWLEEDGPELATHLVATLFDCLLEISNHELLGRGRSMLAWATDDDDVAARAFALWNFVGQPRGARSASVKARHYLLRRF